MQLFSILSVLLVISCCLSVNAQQPDCRRLRERCDACVRRLNDVINLLPDYNRECRQRTIRTWIWTGVTRCQLQEISCAAHRRKLDCGVVAELAGMRRRN
ncbi:uncharacterized protein Dwil_GK27079 [Drosophila willistoni]|uniref:Uncharacterized protein n=1 Tax=Drosophila willistoni TaxID=7260 RepID=A0A0Q9X2U1_DROWI|nr:uncharacterized protein Dwil_GK27079 [Drosophila willistoni]